MGLIICFADWSTLELWFSLMNKYEIIWFFSFCINVNMLLVSKYTKLSILSDHRIRVWKWVSESPAWQNMLSFSVCVTMIKNEFIKVCTWECYSGFISSNLLSITWLYSLENSDKVLFTKPWEIHWKGTYKHLWKDLPLSGKEHSFSILCK